MVPNSLGSSNPFKSAHQFAKVVSSTSSRLIHPGVTVSGEDRDVPRGLVVRLSSLLSGIPRATGSESTALRKFLLFILTARQPDIVSYVRNLFCSFCSERHSEFNSGYR